MNEGERPEPKQSDELLQGADAQRMDPKEFGSLSAPAKQEYHRQQLVQQLESERDYFQGWFDTYQPERTYHLRRVAELHQAERSTKIASGVASLLTLAGGAMLGFRGIPANPWPVVLGASGTTCLVIAIGFQIAARMGWPPFRGQPEEPSPG